MNSLKCKLETMPFVLQNSMGFDECILPSIQHKNLSWILLVSHYKSSISFLIILFYAFVYNLYIFYKTCIYFIFNSSSTNSIMHH